MELIFTLRATQTIQIELLWNSCKPGEFEIVTNRHQDLNSLSWLPTNYLQSLHFLIQSISVQFSKPLLQLKTLALDGTH